MKGTNSAVYFKFLLVMALVLALSGCIEIDINLELNSVGSGHAMIKFLALPGVPFPLSKAMMLQDQGLADATQRGDLKVSDGVENGRQYVALSMNFANISQVEEMLLGINQLMTLTFQRSVNDTCLLRIDFSRKADLPIVTRWQITMPGKIIESSAGAVRGNRVEWSTSTGSGESVSVRSEAGTGFNWIWMVALLAIALGVTGFYLSQSRLASVKSNLVFCTQCGAQQELDAKFCPECGERLS